MTKEDAQALLDVARLDRSDPPPIHPEKFVRGFLAVRSRRGEPVRSMEGAHGQDLVVRGIDRRRGGP